MKISELFFPIYSNFKLFCPYNITTTSQLFYDFFTLPYCIFCKKTITRISEIPILYNKNALIRNISQFGSYLNFLRGGARLLSEHYRHLNSNHFCSKSPFTHHSSVAGDVVLSPFERDHRSTYNERTHTRKETRDKNQQNIF